MAKVLAFERLLLNVLPPVLATVKEREPRVKGLPKTVMVADPVVPSKVMSPARERGPDSVKAPAPARVKVPFKIKPFGVEKIEEVAGPVNVPATTVSGTVEFRV
jgi:hypothetical protein